MQQPSVLVISDHPEFAQSLMGRWHSERMVPAFTVMTSEVYTGHASRSCGLIILGPVETNRLSLLLTSVAQAPQQVIAVLSETTPSNTIAHSSRIMVMRQHEGWLELLILLASECLRRVETIHRAERAEKMAAEASAQATLGRYMLEMRHGLNNALTSVLGNAELLLMQPEQFSGEVRDQLTTIRSMSLRMNEILARFSSLEAELTFAKREALGDPVPFVRATAPGLSSF